MAYVCTTSNQIVRPSEQADRENQIRRVLRRIPPQIIESLPPVLVIELAESMLPQIAKNKIDFRASTRAFGKPLYVRFMVGEETRTRERLFAEHQVGFGKLVTMAAIGGWVITTSAAAAAVLSAYLLKSALGIDLMEGKSFLHDFFFD